MVALDRMQRLIGEKVAVKTLYVERLLTDYLSIADGSSAAASHSHGANR
jgi:hypothetical protein